MIIKISLLIVLILTLFCCAPFPKYRQKPPDELFVNHSGWVEANGPRTHSVKYLSGEIRTYNTYGWRRWQWNEWSAIDDNLDGVADKIYRKIREKDWKWANMYEYYEDTDYDGILDIHYYTLEDNNNKKISQIRIVAPKLGEKIIEANNSAQ